MNRKSPVDEAFILNRITELREQKGVSEYQMSLDLGHSKSYIQNITKGRSSPTVAGLFEIWNYFGITPMDFFDEELRNPVLVNKLVEKTRNLDDNSINAVIGVLDALENKNEGEKEE